MTREELLSLRSGAQALHRPLTSAEAVVSRLGAVQAQEFTQSLLAVGIRVAGSTAAGVEASLDSGAVIRTHVLRPTWHLVHRDDFRWMMALTSPAVAKLAGTQYRRWGLTEDVLSASRRAIEKALANGPTTRKELNLALSEAGFPVDENRSSHHLMDAELNLVICSGPRQGKAIAYDLVERRVPPAPVVDRDEAVARLALRYIQGHGPATDKDFSWWSGLGLLDARQGLQACRPTLTTEPYGDSEVWFDPSQEPGTMKGFRWLPAYDEYIIAFADRSPAMDPPNFERAFTKNGIFLPILLNDGRAVATWSKLNNKPLAVEWFGEPPRGSDEAFEEWKTRLEEFEPRAAGAATKARK
jgi:hypothetical protein